MELRSAAVLLISLSFTAAFPDRHKRWLIVPPTAPTRHQWIAGIGIPVDLENENVVIGYVLKGQYFLPTRASDWRPSYSWDGFDSRRKRRDTGDKNTEEVVVDDLTGQKYVRYNVEPVVVEEGKLDNDIAEDFWDDDDEEENENRDNSVATNFWNSWQQQQQPDASSDTSRWDAYKMMEQLTNSDGSGGRTCVLKMICESAETPMSHKSGILGELMHILFTPSRSKDKIRSASDDDYRKAEEVGKAGKQSCAEVYGDCKRSVLDMITHIGNPVDALFSMMSK